MLVLPGGKEIRSDGLVKKKRVKVVPVAAPVVVTVPVEEKPVAPPKKNTATRLSEKPQLKYRGLSDDRTKVKSAIEFLLKKGGDRVFLPLGLITADELLIAERGLEYSLRRNLFFDLPFREPDALAEELLKLGTLTDPLVEAPVPAALTDANGFTFYESKITEGWTPHGWYGVKTKDLAAWRLAFETPSPSFFVGVDCPICQHASLRRYYETHGVQVPREIEGQPFVGRGSLWEWCRICRYYIHASVLVPDWWKEPNVPNQSATAEPGWIDEIIEARLLTERVAALHVELSASSVVEPVELFPTPVEVAVNSASSNFAAFANEILCELPATDGPRIRRSYHRAGCSDDGCDGCLSEAAFLGCGGEEPSVEAPASVHDQISAVLDELQGLLQRRPDLFELVVRPTGPVRVRQRMIVDREW